MFFSFLSPPSPRFPQAPFRFDPLSFCFSLSTTQNTTLTIIHLSTLVSDWSPFFFLYKHGISREKREANKLIYAWNEQNFWSRNWGLFETNILSRISSSSSSSFSSLTTNISDSYILIIFQKILIPNFFVSLLFFFSFGLTVHDYKYVHNSSCLSLIY